MEEDPVLTNLKILIIGRYGRNNKKSPFFLPLKKKWAQGIEIIEYLFLAKNTFSAEKVKKISYHVSRKFLHP